MASSRTDQQIADELWQAFQSPCSSSPKSSLFIAVSRILAEVRAAEREDRWIPTSEKLPPMGENVLIWDAFNRSWEDAILSTDADETTVFRLSRTDAQDDVIEYGIERVTHWQAGPEPPRSR